MNKETLAFRTKTEIREQNNGRAGDVWEIALDIGYSGVKIFAPNKIACFPAYARPIGNNFQFAGKNPPQSILYKNLDTGDMWVIGEVAQNLITARDTSDSESVLYGRDRYRSRMFKAIVSAGIGIGLLPNKTGAPIGEKIVIQTGLPERYMSDEADLKDVIAASKHFAIQIGSQPWQEFTVSIEENDIFVMSQPKGTLFSICINKEGRFHQDTQKYLTTSGLIFDPGFGTLDIFSINSGVVGNGETFANLGMKRVLQETALAIKDVYGIEVPVPTMQKNLETGTVIYVDKKKFISREYDFSELLKTACEKVCNEAIDKMSEIFDLSTYNYLVVTGGTSEAWYPIIKERLKGLSTLDIILGNQNDSLPLIYSNVRGYFFYRYNKLWKHKQ